MAQPQDIQTEEGSMNKKDTKTPLAKKITIRRMETPPLSTDDHPETKWPTWEPRWKKAEDSKRQSLPSKDDNTDDPAPLGNSEKEEEKQKEDAPKAVENMEGGDDPVPLGTAGKDEIEDEIQDSYVDDPFAEDNSQRVSQRAEEKKEEKKQYYPAIL